MPGPDFPSVAEARSLVPGPDSVAWRYAGDARLFTASGYALLLQVSHPTVGAGVTEHSDFKADPWGRLLRTLDYAYSMVYGGPELATEIGRRVFEMHKRIRGVKPDGEPYHALEPDAYAWVHMTLAEAIVAGHERFGRPLRADQKEALWQDWLRQAPLIGVRDGEMPGSWTSFRLLFRETVAERLQDTEAVHDVLDTLGKPTGPPLPALPRALWPLARVPLSRLGWLATVGLLPPPLRERFGLRWTRAHQAELNAVGALSRATTPLLPRSLRNTGPAYLKARRKALARGDVAALNPDRRSLPSAV